MTKVWAVWLERDYEGVDLESVWDTENAAKSRFEEIKKEPRAYFCDDVFYAELELNKTSRVRRDPVVIPTKPQISYKDWENK